jgi:hypothetical protein
MKRDEKLRLIKQLIKGTVKPEELKSEVEIWMRVIDKEIFKNIKSEETLTLAELNKRELAVGVSKLIKVVYEKGRTIL